MFALKDINKRIIKLLGLSFLVIALICAPISANNFNFFAPPSLEFSVNAQTPASNEKQEIQSDRAQNSVKSKEPESMDITKMVMGVLAGLVLFLYGVTRLAQGLEAIAGDRVKGIQRQIYYKSLCRRINWCSSNNSIRFFVSNYHYCDCNG